MKIAIVSVDASPLSPGTSDFTGQNGHVAALASALGNLGHAVTVFTRRDDPQMPVVVHGPSYRVVHIPAGPPSFVSCDHLLGHIREFAGHLHSWWAADRPDVVHAHRWMSGQATCTAAIPLGIPNVVSFHTLGLSRRRVLGVNDRSPGARLRIEHCVAHQASRIIASATDEVADLARLGVPARDATIVPAAVDAAQFTPVGDTAKRSTKHRVVAVGQLNRNNGFEDVIEVLPGLPNTEFVIAGGTEEASLKDDREAKRIRELAKTLAPHDRRFGIVALEAMACGRPVVANAVGGVRDTVRDGITGFLVPPGNPGALSAALEKVIESSDLGTRMGKAGRDTVIKHYTWPNVAGQAAAVYRKVIQAHQNRLSPAV